MKFLMYLGVFFSVSSVQGCALSGGIPLLPQGSQEIDQLSQQEWRLRMETLQRDIEHTMERTSRITNLLLLLLRNYSQGEEYYKSDHVENITQAR